MERPSGNSVSSQPVIGRHTRSMIPNKLQKRRQIRVAPKKTKSKHKDSLTSILSRRMTSCIFQKPVTIITSHPENKTRYRREEAQLKKPTQLCALKRLQSHQVGDSKGGLSCPMKFTIPIERIALGMQDEANSHSGIEDLLTPGEATSVQPPCLEKTEQVALQLSPSFSSQGVTMPLPLHLSPSYSIQVTNADILRQTWKVKKARQRLAEALKADRLARQAENMRDQRRVENTRRGLGFSTKGFPGVTLVVLEPCPSLQSDDLKGKRHHHPWRLNRDPKYVNYRKPWKKEDPADCIARVLLEGQIPPYPKIMSQYSIIHWTPEMMDPERQDSSAETTAVPTTERLNFNKLL
ncbi:methyl-CpG-binding domain protein 3-like 2B [Apodemus sylvaticus]|uniref:methyl-CpG-binding domain protein 3-like 2B n=1 Tax=Apodemus sylvaticus TaxID=10129 RepID=UPI002243D192|nr:methyl-CpG-binding domain protein 3-like 2B [Apodemus sylvaticus]